MKKSIFVLLLAFMPFFSQAQNLKFGKPTNQEWSLTQCSYDEEAVAVVLCKTIDVQFEMSASFTSFGSQYYDMSAGDISHTGTNHYISESGINENYIVKQRIKVLKEGGQKYANIGVVYYDNPSNREIREEFSEFSIMVFNQVNGKVQKKKISPLPYTDVRIDDQYVERRFQLPDLQVGSIVEYQYTLSSNRFNHIYDLMLQEAIPVEYAKCQLEIPVVLDYSVEATIRPNINSTVTQGKIFLPQEMSVLQAPKSVNSNIYNIVANKLEAMSSDDYVWSVSDYQARVVCELRSMHFPNSARTVLSSTWEQVDKTMYNERMLGDYLYKKSQLADETAALPAAEGVQQRTAQALQLLHSKVKWDGQWALLPQKESEVLKKGSGNSASLNCMLINMLTDMGIDAAPAFISTRSHGALPQTFPAASKFNTVVVRVKDGFQDLFVDAADVNGAINIMNPDLYVDKARVVTRAKKGAWANLTTRAQAGTTVNATALVDASGKVTGTANITMQGNAARNYRAKNPGVNPYEAIVKVEQPIQLQGEVAADGSISFSPYMAGLERPSALEGKDRQLPVELPYKETNSYEITIQVPEGYEVAQLPQSFEISTEDKNISARLYTAVKESSVSLQYHFNARQMFFKPTQYAAVKQVYDLILQHLSTDVITLKKK